MEQHDWLFRAVVRTLLPDAELTRNNKPSLLTQLRDRGVFLIGLEPEPNVNSRDSLAELRPHVPALLDRITCLKPDRIILIKTDVYDTAYAALAAAGLPVSKVPIPFPSSGPADGILQPHLAGH